MNISEARAILSGPLVFGDFNQIKAADFVATWELAHAILEHLELPCCKKCKGDQKINCLCDCGHGHERTCPRCNGTGKENKPQIDYMDEEALKQVIGLAEAV